MGNQVEFNAAIADFSRLKPVSIINSLVPERYDYISLTYTGSDLTGVVYKFGGSGGATVATLTLAYSGGSLATVTRT